MTVTIVAGAQWGDEAKGKMVDLLCDDADIVARLLGRHAAPLVERFAELLRGHGVPTQTGRFGAHMLVEIHNDGPVTIWLEK